MTWPLASLALQQWLESPVCLPNLQAIIYDVRSMQAKSMQLCIDRFKVPWQTFKV
jgi:hypothetical protein